MESKYRNLKDLPSCHLLGQGTSLCAGCGGLEALHQIYDILGEKTVFVNAAGCMTLLTIYPYTPFRGSFLYTSMASAAAGAQGVRDALDLLGQNGRLAAEEDLLVVALGGDGSTYGMGSAAISAAIQRGLDFIYICYDNEGYGNTGQQYSAATPYAALTATSRAGYLGHKPDLFSLWVAQRPSYAATVVASEPLDLAQKIEKARNLKGPRLIHAFSPCPTGWEYEPRQTVELGKLAVKTGIWPLREFSFGQVYHTKVPHSREPVENYLARQGRFQHLFSPQKNQEQIDMIQAEVDRYWQEAHKRGEC